MHPVEPAVTAPSPVPGSAWQLDLARSMVGFQVPYYWGLRTVCGRFTRPYCKLVVSGRLTAVPAELPEPRVSGLGRRAPRGRAARVGAVYDQCQR